MGRGRPEPGLRKQVLQQVLILAEAYSLPMSEARQRIYVEALSDIPIETLSVAIMHIIKTRSFAGNLPTIAEIREEAARLKTIDRPTAAEAWHTLMGALARDREPEGDEALKKAMRVLGNWERLCQLSYRELEFRFRDFERAYNGALDYEDRLLRLGHDHKTQIENREGRLALEDLGES